MEPLTIPQPAPDETTTEARRRHGAPSKQPKRRLVIEITPEQLTHLQQQAQRLGCTLGNMVRRSLFLPDVRQGQRSDLKGRPS